MVGECIYGTMSVTMSLSYMISGFNYRCKW